MIKPSPTTAIEPGLARGTLGAHSPAGDSTPATVTLNFANTNYEMVLNVIGAIRAQVGKRIVGTIRADAGRMDIVQTGGRYFEPVYGSPLRIQGTVLSADNTANTLTINASVPIVCKLTDQRQRAVAFEPGQLVTCELKPGASFTERTPSTE